MDISPSIELSMYPFSGDLLKGCKLYSELAQKSQNLEEIRIHNTACILMGVSSIESKFNEWISINSLIEDAKIPTAFWDQILLQGKTLSLQKKWDLIAALTGAPLWDKGANPFQQYEVIITLRNELVHYKGEFLGKNEAPNKKICDLMRKLNVESNSTFIDDDCSSWVYDLLNSQELGEWVYNEIDNFYSNLMTLLLLKNF